MSLEEYKQYFETYKMSVKELKEKMASFSEEYDRICEDYGLNAPLYSEWMDANPEFEEMNEKLFHYEHGYAKAYDAYCSSLESNRGEIELFGSLNSAYDEESDFVVALCEAGAKSFLFVPPLEEDGSILNMARFRRAGCEVMSLLDRDGKTGFRFRLPDAFF